MRLLERQQGARRLPPVLIEGETRGDSRDPARGGDVRLRDRGAIFLDEVGLLPEGLQAKLLKVLEERPVRRLGSTRDEPIGRVASDSDQRRSQGRDPRARAALARTSTSASRCADYGVTPKTLADDARTALRAYPWTRQRT